jgi:hypothetical protein
MVGQQRNKGNVDQNSRPDDNVKPQPVLTGFRTVYVFDAKNRTLPKVWQVHNLRLRR